MRTLFVLFGLSLSTVAFADVRVIEKPQVTIAPTFDCAATPGAKGGSARVTHSNAATVDETKTVVAVVHTPIGHTDVEVCGSAFKADKTQTLSFVMPMSRDKSFIYTCTARQTSTACNKPLH